MRDKAKKVEGGHREQQSFSNYLRPVQDSAKFPTWLEVE